MKIKFTSQFTSLQHFQDSFLAQSRLLLILNLKLQDYFSTKKHTPPLLLFFYSKLPLSGTMNRSKQLVTLIEKIRLLIEAFLVKILLKRTLFIVICRALYFLTSDPTYHFPVIICCKSLFNYSIYYTLYIMILFSYLLSYYCYFYTFNLTLFFQR